MPWRASTKRPREKGERAAQKRAVSPAKQAVKEPRRSFLQNLANARQVDPKEKQAGKRPPAVTQMESGMAASRTMASVAPIRAVRDLGIEPTATAMRNFCPRKYKEKCRAEPSRACHTSAAKAPREMRQLNMCKPSPPPSKKPPAPSNWIAYPPTQEKW